MNFLNICLTMTSLVGLVAGQGTYSLVPDMQIVPTKKFAEDISKALRDAAKYREGSQETLPFPYKEAVSSESNIDDMLSTLKKLTALLENNQRNMAVTKDPSATEKEISKRSITEETNGSEKVPSVHHHRVIPVVHRRLVRQVHSSDPEFTAIKQTQPHVQH